MKKIRKKRIACLIALGIALCLAGGVAAYANAFYPAQEAALACIADPAEGVRVTEEKDRLVFAPETANAGLIFYPGGNVAMESYAPLMEALAQKGILCVLLRMPLSLAILNVDAAQGVQDDYPQVERWYIGGHSLGGFAASTHAAKNHPDYEGLILLAAYTQSDLRDTALDVLTIYGSEDGVLNRENYENGLPLLPQTYQEIVIDGGCHAYFGAYGAQAGDGQPGITREAQMEQTVQAIAAMIN